MNKKILLILAVLLSFSMAMYAQSAGKLVGVIKDKASGEPLPGVNINLEGTTLGAASDVDGYFVILQVPVGTYDVKASFIGYQSVTQAGIRVSAGITTEANFELSESVIEGEGVLITATKPLVEKNVTQSVSLVTSEELENIPVRGFNNVMALQTSVVVQNNNIHIRGGRNEEVGYYIDGAAAINPLTNRASVHIIQEAVEEFQVLAGGYTAEFGGANSGIIRTEMKTGGSDYHFSVDGFTDKFADEGSEFLNTYSYRHHNVVATLSGPIPGMGDKVRFFLAGENSDQGDRLLRFSEGYNLFRQDFNPNNPANTDHGTLVGGDTLNLVYPDGFTPRNSLERWAGSGTLLFDFAPVSLRISGNYAFTRTYNDTRPMLRQLNDRQRFNDDNTGLVSAKLTHVLNPTTFYSATLGFYSSSNERKDSWFEGEWMDWYNGDLVAERDASVEFRKRREVDQIAWLNPHTHRLNGINFEANGAVPGNLFTYRKTDESYLSGALDFVSQIGRHHELKIGASTRRYVTRRFQIEPGNAMAITELGTSGDPRSVSPALWASQGDYDGYGYDVYGEQIDSDVTLGDSVFQNGPRNPQFSAVYIHDKIEYNDLVVNVGLRWDLFDTDDVRLIDPGNPGVNLSTGLLEPSAFEEVDVFSQVSPRLGISFPVSERTVFYAQYGKFIQMPELNDTYYGNYGLSDQITSGGNFFIQPIGFGLEPIKSTSYELGFRQQVGDVAALELTGFYKNDKGQITVDRQSVPANSSVNTYARLINGDFATTRGLEMKISLRRTNRLQSQLNYTLTKAEGTGSNELSFRSAVARNTARPTLINPLDFNQVHRGSLILDYRFGRDDGGPLFSQFGANALFTFNSGHPYTFVDFSLGQVGAYDAGVDYMLDTRTRQAVEPIGSSTTPWNFNIDLRLDKSFNVVNDLNATVYMRVTNLLNTRNVLNVYQATGNADDDGFINNNELSGSFISQPDLGEEYVELYNAINIANGQSYLSQVGLELWDNPRQIFFGLKLSY